MALLTELEKEKMAGENERLVPYVLNYSFKDSRAEKEELMNAGRLGYCKALNNYDDSEGVRFTTYAFRCIQNEVRYFLRKENRHIKNDVSMNLALANDKNGNPLELEDIISRQDHFDELLPDESMIKNDDNQRVHEAVMRLPEKQRFIILHHFGLLGHKQMTQSEIAKTLNMSQANVSKIESDALEKLTYILDKNVRLHA